MKGFLIFFVLLIGGAIYGFTHTAELSQAAIDRLKAEEGPADPAFYELSSRDAGAFALKYRPFLQRRAKISKYMALVGETALVLSLGKETRDMYEDGPLSTDPDYGEILFRWAMIQEDQSNGQEAFSAQKKYQELFASGPHAAESGAAVQRLMTKFNNLR